MKLCYTCNEIKPLSDFYNKLTARDGKQSHCIACDEARKDSVLDERNVSYFPTSSLLGAPGEIPSQYPRKMVAAFIRANPTGKPPKVKNLWRR